MADNVAITGASGTIIAAADDVGGVFYQRVKVDGGGDGAATPILAGGGVEASALRVTIASDSTGVVSVDDNGSTISVDDGGASLTVDGTVSVSGTVTVGSHAVTNAGTFAVQVDGAALTSLQLIDNIVVVEDAAAAGGESGIQALGVRKDTGGTLASADGDFTPLQMDANGNLRVNVVTGGGTGGTATTDDGAFTAASGSGTPIMGFVTSDSVDSGDVGVLGMLANRQLKVTLFDSSGVELSVGGGTQYTEDAAAAANPVGNALMLVREDARAGSLTTADGDNVAARGTNAGELYVKHVDAIPVTDNSGSLTVDNAGTFAVQATVAAGATNIAKAEDVASADADVGVPAMAVRKATPANTSGTDGDYEMLQMSAGRLWTSATIDAALPAGTNGIGKLTANAGVTIGAVEIAAAQTLATVTSITNVVHVDDNSSSLTVDGTVTASNTTGNVAHDAADSGNPVKVGGKAANAFPTAVANADRADALTDLFGRLLTAHIDPAMQVHKAVTYTSQQTGTAIWDPTSGKKIAITSVIVGSYGTTAGRLILWFGDNADTTYTAGTDQVLLAASYAPSSTSKPGTVYTPAVPIYCTTADRELHITTDAALSVDITVEGYEF